MAGPRSWNIEELFVVVPLCNSLDAVLKTLQLPLSGGNRVTVKKYIDELEISTSHFLGQAHRKGNDTPVVTAISLTEILRENSTYTNTHRLKLRLISEGLKSHACELCGNTLWLGNPIPLELHHKDGIRSNHSLSNLELLCPNCHAFTDNYRAKNAGGVVKRYTLGT